MRLSRMFGSALLTLSVATAAPASAQTATNGEKAHFTAIAVNMSNIGSTRPSQVDINVNRWTSDAARDRLVVLFKEQGPKALLEALRKEPSVGNIRTPDSIGYDLRFARQMPGEDGGTRIVIATDRPIGFWEASNQARTLDYPFTLIELRVDKDGRGMGKLSPATKLTLENNVLVIENFASEPVRLNDVRKTR